MCTRTVPPVSIYFSHTLCTCIEIELVAIILCKQRGEFTQPGSRVYPAMHTHKTAVEYTHPYTHILTSQPYKFHRISTGVAFISLSINHVPRHTQTDRQTDRRTEANPNHNGSTKQLLRIVIGQQKVPIYYSILIYVHMYTNNVLIILLWDGIQQLEILDYTKLLQLTIVVENGDIGDDGFSEHDSIAGWSRLREEELE